MDFRQSQEQDLLRDSARRYFAAAPSDGGWAHFADSGWLAMPVPEECGGLGSPLEDIAILCEEMGRGHSLSAFIGGTLLPARIIGRCTSSPGRASLASALAEGSIRIAVAVYEPHRRYALAPHTQATAMADGGWQISGEKTGVAGGAQAESLMVSAAISRDAGALPLLFLIDAHAVGVTRRIYRTIDDVEAADFSFENVAVSSEQLLAGADVALDVLQASLDEASVCLCAETLGAMDRAIEMTAEYLKMRKQFGQTLAQFQVLQHAVAELWIEANSARSILYRAIAALNADPAQRSKAVSGCFIKLMQAAKTVTGTAIHLHGGIGVSCEYPVGHTLRRVLVSERMLGDREHHLQRYLGGSE